MLGTLFAHESAHYIADIVLGYDPIYRWPNLVFVTEPLPTKPAVIRLAAPQIFTLIFVFLWLTNPSNAALAILTWGTLINLVGASDDLYWIVRRFTWPSGHIMLTTEDEIEYVAFKQK